MNSVKEVFREAPEPTARLKIASAKHPEIVPRISPFRVRGIIVEDPPAPTEPAPAGSCSVGGVSAPPGV
jgi:hypothetical protein